MKKLGMIALVAAVIVTVVPAPIYAQDKLNPDLLTLRELVTFSDRIVIGETVAKTSAWNAAMDQIFRYVSIAVDSTVKGAPGDLEIKAYGGTVGPVTHVIAEGPRFALYERSLLFLAASDVDTLTHDTLTWEILHLNQGKLTVLKNNDDEDVVFWAPSLEHSVTPADSLSPAFEGEPELLSAMLAAIEALL